MDGLRRCNKCGEYMMQIIDYNLGQPYIYYECPNGCNNYYINTTNTSTSLIISKYCSKKNCFCENANNRGYCEFTACIYENALNRGFNQNEK